MLTTVWLDPRSAELRRDHGGGGLPRPAHRGPSLTAAKSTARLIASVVVTCIGLNIVAGDQYVADRAAEPGVSTRVREAWPRAAHAVADGRGHRHRDLAARAVEQLRRLHDRRARGPHRLQYLAVRVLQPPQPDHRRCSTRFTGFRVEHVPPTDTAAGDDAGRDHRNRSPRASKEVRHDSRRRRPRRNRRPRASREEPTKRASRCRRRTRSCSS